MIIIIASYNNIKANLHQAGLQLQPIKTYGLAVDKSADVSSIAAQLVKKLMSGEWRMGGF